MTVERNLLVVIGIDGIGIDGIGIVPEFADMISISSKDNIELKLNLKCNCWSVAVICCVNLNCYHAMLAWPYDNCFKSSWEILLTLWSVYWSANLLTEWKFEYFSLIR